MLLLRLLRRLLVALQTLRLRGGSKIPNRSDLASHRSKGVAGAAFGGGRAKPRLISAAHALETTSSSAWKRGCVALAKATRHLARCTDCLKYGAAQGLSLRSARQR